MSEQATKTEFDFTLTPLENNLLRKFKTLLWVEQKTRFTSDDFRLLGLDKHLKDTKHGIGGIFARAVHNKLIRQVGTRRSVLPQNHLRKIKEYEWITK